MRLLLACVLLLLPVFAAAAPNKIFNNPKDRSSGLRIDECLQPGRGGCGQDAADKFCKDMKEGSGIDFKKARSNSNTFLQGSRGICDVKKEHCFALIQITCGHFTM